MNNIAALSPTHFDRRGGDRLNRAFPVKCRVNKGTFHPSSALDISATGLRMEAPRNYTVGSQVTLHLKPCSTRLMSVQAEVVWTSPKNGSSFEVGLHFTEGQDADFAWLRKWLQGTDEKSTYPRSQFRPLNLLALPTHDEPTNDRRVGDAPPLFNNTTPLLSDIVPLRNEVFQWGGDSPTSSSGCHRCECGAEFPLRVQLALHCELEKHQAAPILSAAAAPVVNEKKKRQVPWGQVVILGLLLVCLGIVGTMRFYSTWLPSINTVAATP